MRIHNKLSQTSGVKKVVIAFWRYLTSTPYADDVLNATDPPRLLHPDCGRVPRNLPAMRQKFLEIQTLDRH